VKAAGGRSRARCDRSVVPKPRDGDDFISYVKVSVCNDLRHRLAVSRAGLPWNGWLTRVGGLSMLATGSLEVFGPVRSVAPIFSWIGVAILVIAPISLFLPEWAVLLYTETPLLRGPRLVHEVSRRGVTTYAGDDSVRHTWKAFARYQETSRFFLLQHNLTRLTRRTPWLGLPKAQLTDAEIDTIRRLLAESPLPRFSWMRPR